MLRVVAIKHMLRKRMPECWPWANLTLNARCLRTRAARLARPRPHATRRHADAVVHREAIAPDCPRQRPLRIRPSHLLHWPRLLPPSSNHGSPTRLGSLTRGARAPLGHRQTVKVARIKDPKLGALHYSFMLLILVYIIIYKACRRPRPPLAADL